MSPFAAKKTDHERVLDDLVSPRDFRPNFLNKKHLGRGGDGEVHSYLHKRTGITIAVKTALEPNYSSARKEIWKEIKNLNLLHGRRQHEGILKMIGTTKVHAVLGLAVILEYADLGDLNKYRWKACEARRIRGLTEFLPEVTLWKFIKDLGGALDFLHNRLDMAYCHNDVKPGNVLVCTPPGWQGKGVPDMPNFRLCDFSRMTICTKLNALTGPLDPDVYKVNGTPEFSVLPSEQKTLVNAAQDMYSWGCSLQYLALGITPVESKLAVCSRLTREGKPIPLRLLDSAVWGQDEWRWRRQTVFRPLDVSMEELVKIHDFYGHMPAKYNPYTTTLSDFNKGLFNPNPEARMTSAESRDDLMVFIDEIIARLQSEAQQKTEKMLVKYGPHVLVDSFDGLRKIWKPVYDPRGGNFEMTSVRKVSSAGWYKANKQIPPIDMNLLNDPEASAKDQKQMLGEAIWDRIAKIKPVWWPQIIGKITGMLLELDNVEIVKLIDDEAALTDAAEEAWEVFNEHATKNGLDVFKADAQSGEPMETS